MSSDALHIGDDDRRRDMARRVRDILNSEFGVFQDQSVRLPDEQDIASGYGVSRSVVREGLRFLVDERLIGRRARSGTLTRAMPPSYVSDHLIDFTNPTRDPAVQANAEVGGLCMISPIPHLSWPALACDRRESGPLLLLMTG